MHYAVSIATIRRMIARGDIEARRIGPKLIRVKMESVESVGRPLQNPTVGAK